MVHRPYLLLVALFIACALEAASPPAEAGPARRWSFAGGVVFEADFPGARLSACEAMADGGYGLVIRPENLPVNPSPWFFFRVSAGAPMTLQVRLRCQSGSMRYIPKISTDGVHWVALPAEAHVRAADAKEAVLQLEVGPTPLWVAAQEPVSTSDLLAWAETLERLPFVSRSTFGASVRGTPLCRLDLGDPACGRHVVIIGRQHPPEITGSLALMRFVEELVGDSQLARDFRASFHVAIMPLLNPDGVDAGNWRHNLGGVDLNRDWRDFVQPETRAVRDQIVALSERGRLFLLLDFHSTFKDVFYVQPPEAVTSPPGFTHRWLDALQARVPDYEVRRSASPVPTPTTSMSWAHNRFGIPSIIYELGDNTERSRLRQVAAAAALEMMTLLLELKDAP
jgi:predicted deacylase